MATASVTYTFISGTLAKSSEVNQNFTDLVTFLNTNAITADAAKAFTAVPSGPSTDPTSGNHLARKAYVDQLGLTALDFSTSNGSIFSVSSVTDMSLTNVSVVQDHVYAVHFHGTYQITAGSWDIRARVNGAVIGRFYTTLGQSNIGEVDGTVYWTAPATQATDDFDVQAEEIGGGGTFQLLASASDPRWFTVTSLGKL